MSKKVKVCLALFLSFAVLAQYSFTPQAMVAYGMDNTVEAAQAEESSSDSGQSSEKQEATKPAPEPTKATEAPAPTPAPAATTESTQATETTESTVPEEQSDDVEDENDVNTGDPIAGEDQAAEQEEAAEEETEEDADEEFPAVSFTKSAGGVTVHISAPEGALPEGATVRVTAVSAEQYMGAIESAVGGEVEKAKAVDITFYKKNGKEVKPKKAVSVKMTASGISADSVVHIADGGSANAIGAATSGSSASFKTANFSIYALVEGTQVASENAITINYAASEGGSVSPGSETIDLTAESVAAKGSTAEAENGYKFVSWTDSNGKVVSENASFTPNVSKLENGEGEAPSEITFTANFEAVEQVIVTFDPNVEEGDSLAPISVAVNKGEAIGDKIPAVPQVAGYNTKWVFEDSGKEVTADFVVNESFNAVVAKEKISYTVTFVQEDGTEETRTTDIDAGFAINDLPEVTPKTNKVGKWVYSGTTNEFTVGTVVSEDLIVEAYYEQNIFTVKFMVDGTQYEEMTTATDTTIVLPSDPIKAGATFKGWFTEEEGQGTQYTAESTVDKDLTLYAYFEDQVRVKFLVKDDDGNVISDKSQYFIDLEAGDEITTLPDDPFIEGKTFVRWENEDNGDTVDVGYTVEKSFNAVAVFSGIETYELTVNYFYTNDGGDRVGIGSQVYDLVGSDFPYTVTAPGYTIATEVTDEPTYYPSQPTITVEAEQFTKKGDKYVLSVDDEFVAADAQYKVGHYLKALDGDGYELIETVTKDGVKNSRVTPEIKNYSYAVYTNRDEDVTITGDADQELKVYYDRRSFTLSYNVGEGTYIDAVTAPYGTEITLPETAERTGYTFTGWFKDSACTEAAGNSITLEADTTLYAKWNPAQSTYKIVYMIENADDDGFSYLATVTKEAETGSSITMTAQTAGANGTRPSELDRTNFTFKDSTTETVKADGTTVVTVRYSRNVYTITWKGSGYEDYNPYTYGIPATWHTGRGHATLTAKYGANISALWASTFNTPHPNWCWNFSGQANNRNTFASYNNEKFTSLEIMPSGNKTVYHWVYTTTKKQILNYWLENYETTQGEKTRNGHTYGLLKSVVSHYNWLEQSDYPEYEGYTKAGMVRSDGKTGYGNNNNGTFGNNDVTVDFYYNAEQYPLTFYNYNGTLISSKQVTLGNDISAELTGNVPAAPMEGATWRGWFTDQGHTSAYSGGTKMPAGLILYGDFTFPTRTVTFDSQGGTEVDAQADEYGFYATAPADPTKEGYVFQGWFTAADETGSPYDWNKPVTEDITLYAHWTQKTISYTVHYYEKDTTISVVPDKVVSDPNLQNKQTITESAPTVAGHVADAATKSLELSFDDESNVIIFYYDVIPDELTYTVNYVLKDHPKIKVAESKEVTVSGTTTNALELAVEVDKAYMATQTSDEDILGMHYKPTETSKELQLALENNVITFEYVPYTTSKITVNYLDMDGKTIHASDTSYVEKGDTFTVQNKAPDGYVYHHAYLDGTTTAPEAAYQITGEEGNLVINVYYQKKLIIIAKNKSKAYDGTPLVSNGLGDATVTGTLRGDVLASVEYSGSQTDAGTSATTPKNAVITKGGQAITDPEVYYSIIYVPGSLTVKPISVYISISADQWNTHSGATGPNYYTGKVFNVGFTNPYKQHFNDGAGSAYVSITSGQRALFKETYGDAIWNALYGTNGALISKKNAGTYTFTGAQQKSLLSGVTVDGQAMMADPNYSITLYARDSFLTIEPLPLVISTGSDEKEYDGTPLTKTDDAAITYSYWTANIGGSWTPETKVGAGEVTLGTGDTIKFNVTGSQTKVGESENSYEIDWGKALSSNYSIVDTKGTLKVTKAELTVTVNDKTSAYTGGEQSGYGFPAEGVTGTGSKISTTDYTVEGLGKGDVLKVTYTEAKGTNAGTYDNGSFAEEYTIVDAAGNDVSSSYKSPPTLKPGKLTIKPITDEYKITVTGKSDTKTYNGSEQSVNGYTVSNYDDSITFTGIAQDDAKATAKGTKADTYTMTMKASDFSAVSPNYTNIKITVVPGTLTITPIDEYTITVTGNSDTKAYNGSEQSVSGYEVSKYDDSITFEGPAQDDAKATAKGTNANTYTMALSEADFTATSDNYKKINIIVKPGTLTITPITDEYEITVTGNSDTKVYNGSEQSVSGYTVSEYDSTIELDGPAQDSAKATAKGTNVDTYTMTMTKDDFTATSVNYTNIKITVVPGTLEITPITDEYEIKVTGNSDTKVYNGSEQSVNGYEVSKYDDSITFTGPAQDSDKATAKGTNAGEYVMPMTKDDFTATSPNYTNIKITVIPGKLKITPIEDEYEITVTGNSDTKVYNGSEQSVNGYTVSEYDSTITFTGIDQKDAKATAKGTNANTYTMTMSEADFSAMSPNYTNIKITVVPGKLTITPIEDEYEITVTGNSDTKVYNGSEQSVSGYDVSEYDSTITFTGIAQDDAKATAKGTNANTYTMTMGEADFTATSDNYTNIKIAVVPGKLTITPAQLPEDPDDPDDPANKRFDVSKPANVVYNGEEQKQPVTVTDKDAEKVLVEGTDCTIEYSSDMTNVGTVTITITGKGNYKGTFTRTYKITPRPVTVTITGDSDNQKYNGEEQSISGYDTKISDELYKESDISFSGTAAAKATDAGSYSMGLTASKFTNNNKNFDVTFNVTDGKLTITKRNVTVTSASATKVYDGTALTNNRITISGDGFVDGETPAFRVTGSQTAVGSSKNTFDILSNSVRSSAVLDLVTAAANGYKAGNYNITKVYGTLTVTAAPAPTPTPTPAPDGGGNNPGGGGNPGGGVTPAAPFNPIPAAIDDTPAPTTIIDDDAPRAATGFWALINLICAILTALLSLIMLIRYFGKRREEDEETGEVTEIKRKGGVKLASIIPAIGAIIAFILTEDMSLPMQMIDKWTILMVVILAIQVLVAFFSRKKEEEEDQEDEGAMA